MTEPQKSSHSQPRWKNIWIHGFVLGIGVVLIGSLVWLFIRGTPSSPPSITGEKAAEVQSPQEKSEPAQGLPVDPAVTPPTPVDSLAVLKSELAQVLAGIKEANQHKDLPQLLSHYSPNFPQLQQRVQNISKTWKIYDYPKMDFEITEVRLLAGKTAEARVTWKVEARNISTLKNENISKNYLIRFARESGQWRIKALDKAE
jgi:hypothetical protein